jgi:hypothetical protein
METKEAIFCGNGKEVTFNDGGSKHTMLKLMISNLKLKKNKVQRM